LHVVRAQRLLPDLEGALEHGPAALEVTLVQQDQSQAVQAPGDLGRVRAEQVLSDPERALVELARGSRVTLEEACVGEAAQGVRRVGALGTTGLLVDAERPLVRRPRAGEIPGLLQELTEQLEHVGHVGVIRAARLLAEGERLLRLRDPVAIAALSEVTLSGDLELPRAPEGRVLRGGGVRLGLGRVAQVAAPDWVRLRDGPAQAAAHSAGQDEAWQEADEAAQHGQVAARRGGGRTAGSHTVPHWARVARYWASSDSSAARLSRPVRA